MVFGNRGVLLADANALNDVSVTVPNALMFKPAARSWHIDRRRRVIRGVVAWLGRRAANEGANGEAPEQARRHGAADCRCRCRDEAWENSKRGETDGKD